MEFKTIKIYAHDYNAIKKVAHQDDKAMIRVLARAIENYMKQRRMSAFLIKK